MGPMKPVYATSPKHKCPYVLKKGVRYISYLEIKLVYSCSSESHKNEEQYSS